MPNTLTDTDIRAAAAQVGVDFPALRAVCEVESGGNGFLPDGRLKILFERHILWQRLRTPDRNINPMTLSMARPGLCGPQWDRSYYGAGGMHQWDRVQAVIDWAQKNAPTQYESYKRAAYEACSWGLFQQMGYHYASLGYADVYAFKHDLETGEAAQLSCILRWMGCNGLLRHLINHDWHEFVRGYNGAGQVPVYTVRLLRAYRQFGGK